MNKVGWGVKVTIDYLIYACIILGLNFLGMCIGYYGMEWLFGD